MTAQRSVDSARRNAVVRRLAEKLQHFKRPDRQGGTKGQYSTGFQALDVLLPDGGIGDGALVEWLSDGPGSGAGTLAFAVTVHRLAADPARAACVVVDPSREFYPPAIHRWKHDPDRVIVVHPPNARETLWSVEQALRCPGVGVVVSWLDAIGAHAFRRLQLAGESGGGVGLLLRPAVYRAEPSWAAVRFLVGALPGRPMDHPEVTRPEEWVARPESSKGVVGVRQGIVGTSATPIEDSGRATLSVDSGRATLPRPRRATHFGRRLRVELVHCRGRLAAGSVELEIDDETSDVRLVSQLADPTAPTRRARVC